MGRSQQEPGDGSTVRRADPGLVRPDLGCAPGGHVREYYHIGGRSGPGPPVPEFDELMGRYIVQTDPARLNRVAAEIGRSVYEQALYAVNRHVDFVGHATAFKLAESEVNEEHWSRRNG